MSFHGPSSAIRATKQQRFGDSSSRRLLYARYPSTSHSPLDSGSSQRCALYCNGTKREVMRTYATRSVSVDLMNEHVVFTNYVRPPHEWNSNGLWRVRYYNPAASQPIVPPLNIVGAQSAAAIRRAQSDQASSQPFQNRQAAAIAMGYRDCSDG